MTVFRLVVTAIALVALQDKAYSIDMFAGKRAVACTDIQAVRDVMNILSIDHTHDDLAPYLGGSTGQCIIFKPETKITVVDRLGDFDQFFYRAPNGKLVKLWISDGELGFPPEAPNPDKGYRYMVNDGFACDAATESQLSELDPEKFQGVPMGMFSVIDENKIVYPEAFMDEYNAFASKNEIQGKGCLPLRKGTRIKLARGESMFVPTDEQQSVELGNDIRTEFKVRTMWLSEKPPK